MKASQIFGVLAVASLLVLSAITVVALGGVGGIAALAGASGALSSLGLGIGSFLSASANLLFGLVGGSTLAAGVVGTAATGLTYAGLTNVGQAIDSAQAISHEAKYANQPADRRVRGENTLTNASRVTEYDNPLATRSDWAETRGHQDPSPGKSKGR